MNTSPRLPSLLAALVSVSSLAAPTIHPNSVRYSDKNPAAATGRSGTAVLTSRILVNRDGTADVDVTTGQLDAAGPGFGSITRLQFKELLPDDTVGYLKNYNGLSGGAHHFVWNDLARGRSLQTQANIVGVDGRRTDVITVTGVAWLRPDLAVELSAPASIAVNQVVNLTALVSERNGDVGASADCVLYVDGAAADRANGIWVDNGSAVTCAFATVFSTPGAHAVRVALEGVTPADWDSSNDGASATVEVVAPPAVLRAGFVAGDMVMTGTQHFRSRQTNTVNGVTTTTETKNEYVNVGRYQQINLSASTSAELQWPLMMTFTVAAGADVRTATLGQLNPSFAYTSNGSTYTCSIANSVGFEGSWVVCTIEGGGTRTSSIQFSHNAGEVTYFSRTYTSWWNSAGQSGSSAAIVPGYSYNNPPGITRMELGAIVPMSLRVQTGAGGYLVSVEAPMGPPVGNSFSQPPSCMGTPIGAIGFTVENCFWMSNSFTMANAYGNGESTLTP